MQTLLDVINDNIKPNTTKKTQKSEGNENEGLFSALLNSVNNENVDETSVINAVLNFKQNVKSQNELSSNLTKISEPKNLFEASNFLQILSLLEVLNGGKINKFPILNSKMTEFFAIEKNVLEIKSTKNINELIKISQKFDLGLEKINITKDLTNKFEKEFVNLAKKDFFKLDNSLKFDEITKSQINKMSKSETKKEDINLPKLLANLENTTEQKSTLAKDKTLDLNQENITNDKKPKFDMQNIKIPSEETKKQDIKLNQTEQKISNELSSKNEINADISKIASKQELKSDMLDKNISEQKISQPKQTETEANLQNKNLNSEAKFDKVAKSDEIINKMSQKIPENIQKSEINQDKNIERKSQDNFQVKQNISKDDMLKAALNPSMQNGEEQNKKDDNAQNQNKSNNNDEQLNLIVKDIVKNAQNQMKNIDTKKTLESFATTLKEQVENYKPPIMRVNLVLNPEKLGEVEITIVNRGNNLHINFNSTPQTMNLFLQNQAEFKASLVNMGFSELQMNFSDQNQNKDQSQNSKKFRFSKEDDDFNDNDMEQNLLEVIVPRYI